MTLAQNDESRPAWAEHVGALVDGRASLKLLGCHEARRARLPLAIERIGTGPIRVEIAQMNLPVLEIEDDGTIVKVHRHKPALPVEPLLGPSPSGVDTRVATTRMS